MHCGRCTSRLDTVRYDEFFRPKVKAEKLSETREQKILIDMNRSLGAFPRTDHSRHRRGHNLGCLFGNVGG